MNLKDHPLAIYVTGLAYLHNLHILLLLCYSYTHEYKQNNKLQVVRSAFTDGQLLALQNAYQL